jgi:hypothetical protein
MKIMHLLTGLFLAAVTLHIDNRAIQNIQGRSIPLSQRSVSKSNKTISERTTTNKPEQ